MATPLRLAHASRAKQTHLLCCGFVQRGAVGEDSGPEGHTMEKLLATGPNQLYGYKLTIFPMTFGKIHVITM